MALMPRSLLVFKDHAYTSCMHGIDAVGVHSATYLVKQAEAPALFVGCTVLITLQGLCKPHVVGNDHMAAGARGCT